MKDCLQHTINANDWFVIKGVYGIFFITGTQQLARFQLNKIPVITSDNLISTYHVVILNNNNVSEFKDILSLDGYSLNTIIKDIKYHCLDIIKVSTNEEIEAYILINQKEKNNKFELFRSYNEMFR